MKLGFVGAGKVGSSFAIYLNAKGEIVTGFYSKGKEKCMEISKRIGCQCYASLYELVEASDMVGITVNDDQIRFVVEEIHSLDLDLSEKMFFHMSGVYGSEVLQKLNPHVFSLHPLKAFPKIESSLDLFREIYFSVENADEQVLKWIHKIGINFFEIDAKQKTQYHAAAVILSNYLVALVDYGLSQLEAIGIDKSLAFKAMRPLIQDTLSNVEKYGTHQALTGPIARGDVETVRKHLDSLNSSQDWLYKALGNYTLELADLDEEKRTIFRDILKGGKS